MQRVLSIVFSLIIILSSLQAQTEDCPTCPPNGTVDQTEYDVIKTEDMMYEGEFVPGEILIKYKDEVNTVLGKSNKGTVITGISAIDAVFEKHQITEAQKLFPKAEKLQQKQILKSFNGYEFERPSLHNIQKLKISEEAERVNIYEVIEELKQIPEVEYAEPNYIYAIVEDEAISPELSEEEMIEWLEKNSDPTKFKSTIQQINKSTNTNAVVPNDPLYDQQWGIPATQIDAVWDSTTGDENQIIAVLDTGVDWLHPDLKNKIWTNPDEIPDNGIDDDGNGFVDDIRGWDYINNDNDPKDDNSHGTHVAGIAAAESNNGIGIAGVNWKAKIMPIKVFQSSGRGDAATITEGIVYASEKGADVINMSFSSLSRSFTMEAALANAYANTILVAAAGNDGCKIGPPEIACTRRRWPAAISYVLGIEATTSGGSRPSFSNYDQDGPVFSRYEELNNYELKAPGANIISSIPNGNYRVYNGTSMSTPLVAGAVALYKDVYPSQSQELMWGNFINTISNHIQLFDAINIQADPKLWFVSNTIVDTLDGDGDGRVDAGETIELWFEVRNTWGQSDSVWCGIRFGEFEDTTTATILQDKSFIGSISPYARRTNEMNPLKIQIDPNVVHDRDIVFESLLWYQGSSDTVKQQIVINVENGEELFGIIDTTLVLGPDKLWLINASFGISGGGNLIIQPGTKIILNKPIINNGKIVAIGKSDSLIYFESASLGSFYAIYGNGMIEISFCEFYGFSYSFYMSNSTFNSVEYSRFLSCSKGIGVGIDEFSNNVVKNCKLFAGWMDSDTINFKFNNITENNQVTIGSKIYSSSQVRFNNFNKTVNSDRYKGIFEIDEDPLILMHNNFTANNTALTAGYNTMQTFNINQNYWGSNKESLINNALYDFYDDPILALLDYVPYLSQPTDSAHGIVWKVLVDGIDPQDEHLDPIGVGAHRFDVYFNRPMDTDYTPSLSFGVREPFTQQAVTDSSFWSADSMIWTAYKTMQLYTGDGINRIRVADARDTEDFEIPIEDQRFEFVIDAAGLSSVDFNAIAGLGKISLDWIKPEDVTDLLGYNLYRFTNITDSTYTDTLMINSEMILDTTYTDYDVIPGNNYYYQYTAVKTDFSESDLSKVVGTQALTSSAGDANGDLAVNVLDITSMVSYLLNQNPQPFIFEAADVDTNGVINVLDIVKSINIIMGVKVPKINSKEQSAELAVDGNSIRIKEGEEISGIEFKIIGEGIEGADIIGGALLNGMEYGHSYNKDTLKVLVYSFKNKPFNAKDGELLKLSKGKIISVDEITAGDMNGNMVSINGGSAEVMIPDNYILYQNYPNPFNPTTTIKYGLPKPANVEITIYNILGQRIKTFILPEQSSGYHQVIWNSSNSYGRRVSTGVYIYQIKTDKWVDQKKMLLLK